MNRTRYHANSPDNACTTPHARTGGQKTEPVRADESAAVPPNEQQHRTPHTSIMSSSNIEPQSESAVQQSLNILSNSIVIERNTDGGARSVASGVPEPDPENNVTVKETSSEVGKPRVEYPVERDHCTVTKYVKRKSYSHSSYSARHEYKEFDIQVDREAEPAAAEHLENVIQRVAKLEDLRSTVAEIQTYDELVEQAAVVREYETTYRIVKGIWDHDSLKSYALEYTPRHFEIEQFPQGFFCVPGPHHTNVRQILDEKLQEEGIAKYSVAWGGFIVDPDDFSEIYEIVKPAYHTPDIDDTLSRETLD